MTFWLQYRNPAQHKWRSLVQNCRHTLDTTGLKEQHVLVLVHATYDSTRKSLNALLDQERIRTHLVEQITDLDRFLSTSKCLYSVFPGFLDRSLENADILWSLLQHLIFWIEHQVGQGRGTECSNLLTNFIGHLNELQNKCDGALIYVEIPQCRDRLQEESLDAIYDISMLIECMITSLKTLDGKKSEYSTFFVTFYALFQNIN